MANPPLEPFYETHFVVKLLSNTKIRKSVADESSRKKRGAVYWWPARL
jgi:hypothetical protein